MQNLKYKALSIAMAVMTAASPVLSSYTAYASDNVADNIVVNDDGTVSQTFNLEDNNDDSSEEKETKFLFLLTLKQLVVKPSYQKEKTRSRPSAWMKT